jgi:branched-chain amino acid transport system substrate-binding protein
MTRRSAALLLCGALRGVARQVSPPPPKPYKDSRNSPSSFEGPGRELPEPKNISEVVIGYYGPPDETHPDGGILWQGAVLALEEANREGGYKGKPFRLAARWSEDPWRGGAAAVTRLVFEDRAWAIVGSIDGAGTHLAEQVIVKALLTLVNPVATDRSIHMAGVPWMFSVVQGDDQHTALLAHAFKSKGVALWSATDHDARAFTSYLLPAMKRESVEIKLHLEFDAGRQDLSESARRIAAANAPAIIVAAARPSARAVRALREADFTGTLAGGPWLGRAAFAEEAGSAADGALFPWVGKPSEDFARKFSERFRRQPDYAAAGAYDAVRIVVATTRKAGLNRARIRDAVQQLGAWQGAGGLVEWDEFGQNRRPPRLATIESGSPAVAGRAAIPANVPSLPPVFQPARSR